MTDKTNSYIASSSEGFELLFVAGENPEKDDPSLCASDSYNERLKDKHITAQPRSDSYKKLLDKFLNRIPPKGTVVDIGCGMGIEINYFASLGFNVFGIDIAEEAVRIAKENYPDLNFICGNLSDLSNFRDIKINAIFDRLSLTHLPKNSISEYLGKVYQRLEPEGVIQVTFEKDKEGHSQTGWYLVPYGHFPKDEKTKETQAICKMLYLSIFAEEELKQLFEKNGFTIVDFDTYLETDAPRELMTLTAQK